MIKAESWIKVDFDSEGSNQISDAIKTMEEIKDEIGKITTGTDWWYKLDEAVGVLNDILSGEMY